FLHLPPGIRRRLEQVQLSRLRRLRDAITTHARLSMPPIDVDPCGWVVPGSGRLGFACAYPLRRDQGHECVVLVPASTLFVVDPDVLLRRVLRHEYAHWFWGKGEMFSAMEEGRNEIRDAVGGSTLDQMRAIEKVDSQRLVAPAEWFGEEDVRHFIAE